MNQCPETKTLYGVNWETFCSSKFEAVGDDRYKSNEPSEQSQANYEGLGYRQIISRKMSSWSWDRNKYGVVGPEDLFYICFLW